MNFNHRAGAYLILRWTLAFVFLFFGIGKLVQGPAQFAAALDKDFATTWLPAFAVHLFGLLLPFLELSIGILLIAGMFTRLTLIFAGLLLIALTVGLLISGGGENIPHNLIYSMIIFLLLYYADDNAYSLDSRFGERR